MASAHPELETLASFAAGTLSDGMSLLVSSHLTYCPTCRKRVSLMEDVGGAFVCASDADMSDGALSAALAAIDGEGSVPAPAKAAQYDDTSPLPRAIQDVIAAPLDDLPWQFRLPGLHEYKLSGFDGEDVSLIRAKPGARMLAHTHTGEEATLIFSGAMQDGDTVYRKGDVAQADHSHDHHPEIVGDEVCYCLIVMAGGMQFTGRFSRALNVLTR
ncbi:putative transcriptional regulator [Rubricella aquisinus]|uniref:Putative transcriptional regulator n=1 Tax=Rubricella aquisinus TaxID=2028108 RepID=A0A840WM75_9RHOB|nr:ChrR family anti-sigma-E factor [Rubricella aquisinus]MBB5516159.1 putative transcriptional regulator [Rubricella aquisinus]